MSLKHDKVKKDNPEDNFGVRFYTNNGHLIKENMNPLKMEKEKSLVVSQKIRKADKYIPLKWVYEIEQEIDNARDRAYFLYHLNTGLRVSDVIGTEIVHIDWQHCKTYTYDHKKDKWRWIYWPEKVKAPLKMWMKQRQMEDIKDKRLFPFTDKTANRIVKRWAIAVGFPYSKQVASHWLRHTFIRLSRAVGRDMKAVQQNTGDTVKTILEWYSELSEEDMRKQMDEKPIMGEINNGTMEK